MATTFVTPIVSVSLADTLRRRYDIAAGDEPFFIYDRLADLHKQGKLVSSSYAANTLAQFGAQPVTHCIPVDRKHLKGVMLRPFYRQPIPWPRADGTPTRRWGVVTVPNPTGGLWGTHSAGEVINDFLDNYTFLPTSTDNWDFVLADDGLLYEMTQKVSYTGDGDQLSDWVVSVVGFAGTPDPEAEEINRGLCPNPFFTVGFRRQALPPEFIAAVQTATGAIEYASTQIVWGVNGEVYPQGKWMLHVPITGKPTLYERLLTGHPWSSETEAYWYPRQWTEGDLSEIKPERAAKQGYTYHIGTIGHAICVSEGGFDGDGGFAYYLVENAAEPVVPYGEMFIRNWPGQCTFWLDLNVFPVGELARWPFVVPSFRSADVSSVVLGQPFSTSLQTATQQEGQVVDELPGVEGMAVDMEPLGLYEDMEIDTLLRWRMRLTPGTYPEEADPTEEVVTQTTPFVEAVQLYQNPQLTDNGAMTFTELGQGVIDLVTEAELEDTTAAIQQLTLVNAEESFLPDDQEPEPDGGWSPTYEVVPGRQVRLAEVGWRVKDLTTYVESNSVVNMGDYFVLNPHRERRAASFVVTDLLGMVALNKWDGETDLNFRGWLVSEALAFALEYNGIGTAQYELEETGLLVPDDDDQNHRIGTSWLKIMQGLLDEGGVLWTDYSDNKVKTGCRYCRTARTAANVLDHADNAWLSSACLAADVVRAGATGVDFLAVVNPTGAGAAYPQYPVVEFQADEATLSERDHANTITVVGSRPSVPRATKRREGWAWESPQLIARWRNRAALDWEYIEANPTAVTEYLGWPVSHVERDDSLVTQQEVDRRLAEIAARKATRAKKARFYVPMLNTIRPGMVTEVQGAAYAACDGLLFRVTGVRHEPGRSRTRITAREMVGLPAV